MLFRSVVLDWRSDGRRHQARRNLDILTPLTLTTDDLSCVLGLLEEEKKEARQFLTSFRKKYSLLVGFHPGAGKIPNRWNADRFASVANRLHKEFNAGIVITSGPMDREPVAEMLSHLTCEYLLVERQSIRNVAAILDTLDLYVTNDTGTMHIAGAVSTSVLALFGPTDPLQWAPLNQKNHYIAAKDGDMNLILEGEVFDMASLMLQQSKHL